VAKTSGDHTMLGGFVYTSVLDRRMALNFRPAENPLHDLQVWQAESSEYSFVISHDLEREASWQAALYCLLAIEAQQEARRCARWLTVCDA
jgi:hypothetical protein